MPANLYEGRIFEQRPRLREACIQLDNMARDLGAESKLPTMTELRSRLGISLQVLNDAVRELESRNVLRTINGVGIYVAAGHKRPVTGNIAFISNSGLSAVQNIPYWGRLLAGMRAELAEKRRNLLLIDDFRTFVDWGTVDGAILCGGNSQLFKAWVSGDSELAARHGQENLIPLPGSLPRVGLIDRVEGISNVVSDDFQGTYLLTRHLIECGHTRIAFMADVSIPSQPIQQRQNGYLQALKEVGIEPPPNWVRTLERFEGGENSIDWFPRLSYLTTRQWLAEGWKESGCTALVTQNDQCAIGAISAFREAGLEVPGDISVTGFDATNDDFVPRLTSVQVPLFEMGRAAVRTLIEQLDNSAQIAETICLPVRMITGGTSDRLAL